MSKCTLPATLLPLSIHGGQVRNLKSSKSDQLPLTLRNMHYQVQVKLYKMPKKHMINITSRFLLHFIVCPMYTCSLGAVSCISV